MIAALIVGTVSSLAVTPLLVAADEPDAVDRAAAELRAGRPIVMPTETVYGLAASPMVPGATAALFVLKGRPEAVPLAVLIDGFDQIADWVEPPSQAARRLMARWWPGPLTLVFNRRPAAVDLALGGTTQTVGVRCPDHWFVRSLARQVGPIATTSANRHGRPTPVTASDATRSLAGAVALVVDGGPCQGLPSTVVDVTGSELRLLREGALSEAAVRASAAADR